MKIDSIATSAYGSTYGTQALSANTGTGASSGASGNAQSSSAAGVTVSISDYYYDVRDLNKDGVVTLEEEIIYALTRGGQLPGQAAAAGNAQGTAGYNRQGSLQENPDSNRESIDLIV